jgi:signal transduction histidine kinase
MNGLPHAPGSAPYLSPGDTRDAKAAIKRPPAPDTVPDHPTMFGLDRDASARALERELGFAPDAAQREAVADEQLRMVLAHTRLGTIGATVFGVLAALPMQGSVPLAVVHGWIAAKVIVALCRIVLAQFYTRSPGLFKGITWRRLTFTFLAVDGAVWGLAGWRMMDEPVPLASLAAAILACVTSVATFGLQMRALATAAYAAPILLPTVVGMMVRADLFGIVGGSGLLVLLVLLMATARAAERRAIVGMLLRMQAQSLAAQREAALQLAQRQSVAKSQFLAKISHELRTPLHGILGLARLLHMEVSDPGPARRVELIETSGSHLLALINDLLDVSRMEAGRFTVRAELFELVAEIRQVADVFAVRAADKGLGFAPQLHLPDPHWVVGDPARVRQVLHNLLGNAIKFTQRGGIGLTVSFGGAPDLVRVEVRDTGSGIAEEDLAHIFKPFQQSESESNQPQDGAGLGLTIALEIAQAIGGDIAVKSRPGVGSTFIFTARLPPSAAPPQLRTEAVLARPVVARPGGRRVLVAEDDDVNAMIVMAYLEALGLAAERVANGKDAVGRALRDLDRPDVILMDCRMPVMDGLEATREIRQQEQALGLPRIPVIALTATSADTDRADCLAAGMDDFVTKPFTRQDLLRTIDQWCRVASAG